ncbi:hypothetical protein IAG25_32810 [Caballeronia sp. EK]|uniref:hypothetical protein n=1 Tax=Caballeronia sp. EK TaxID=2767469 RepID=UPI001656689B|nr:hypothetical protein [Caballeronia sp. EK]MBC8641607.1 hypothetical protein [Caballeronia sp. EK]
MMDNRESDAISTMRRVNEFLTADVLIGVVLCVFAFFVIGKLEGEGLQQFATDWFWPVGGIVALVGVVVGFVVANRHRRLGQYLVFVFLAGYFPAFLHFLMAGEEHTPESLKLAVSLWLMLAPWLAAASFFAEARFEKRRKVEAEATDRA